MSQSLYRKYRSQTFDELVGQEHVTRTLLNAIRTGRIAHAYLFCGPRGTGKTSTARLLAKAANCLSEGQRPCNACAACVSINEGRALDLIEIDAASRRKVEDIAELIERVSFAPAELRYKVYIIDEVHMLTAHAFNALLKTLEEPPETAIFILATTEVWKVLPTIVSRCQRFDFRRIPTGEVVRRLETVAGEEGLTVRPEALAAIARLSTGSLRDALGLLDQLTVYGAEEITLEQLQSLLGTVGSQRVARFVDAVLDRHAGAGLEYLHQWSQEGMDARQFTQELVEYLRNLLLLKVSGGKGQALDLTHEAIESMRAQAARAELHRLLDVTERFSTLDHTLRTGPYGYLPLELALVASTAEPPAPAQAAPSAPAQRTEPPRAEYRPAERPRPAAPAAARPTAPAAAAVATVQEPAPEADAGGTTGFDRIIRVWPRMLTSPQLNKMLQALLKDCRPLSMEGDKVVLGFRYVFHKSKVEEPANLAAVEQSLSRLAGQPVTIACAMGEGDGEPAAAPAPTAAATGDQLLAEPRVKAALNIFNGKISEINGGEG